MKHMLAELQSGRLLELHECEPHDCVIRLSANGYWLPSSEVISTDRFEMCINESGKAVPKRGYTISCQDAGWFRDVDHLRQFYKDYMRDPIVEIV